MHTSSPEFVTAYQKLNIHQKQAVDTIDGPVMVIAGPGTGKTQILATRIANILLKTDTPPYAILALTFTESAAKNMRERLIQLIGPTGYSVNVQTFHSFCDEVIRSYPEYFALNGESTVLTDLERYDIMEWILQHTKLAALRTINSPYHYIKAIIKTISDLKREGVHEVKFADLVNAEIAHFDKTELKKTEVLKAEKRLAKLQDLAVIYTAYQQELLFRKRYDYDDMIAFVVEAFETHEELLLSYQEKLTYLLVDEYQDTNSSQNRVVDLLASYWGERANVFVVGDPHQSIYRFQGASLENTLSFARRYPSATTITLETGYRCPQSIYDAAAEVIAHNAVETDEKLVKSLRKTLHSVTPDGQPIQIFSAPSAALETVFVAEEVKKLVDSGVPAKEVAILYRNNADSFDTQLALDKWNVPYTIDGGNDVLQNEVIVQFLTLLKVIADIRTSSEQHELFEVMNYPWLGLDREIVFKVARAAGQSKMSMYERITAGYAAFHTLKFCEDVTAMEFEGVEAFVARLAEWSQQDAELTFPEWFESVMNESGFLTWVLNQSTKFTHLNHLNALYREVKTLSQSDHRLHLEKFLQSLATMREHSIQLTAEDTPSEHDAVHLSTVHKAKGQEWKYVFLVQCVDGKWGGSRKMSELPLPEGILTMTNAEEQDRDEDDRRLFYVAITRAKKQATISFAETSVTGNRVKLHVPSLFLSEISDAHKTEVHREELTTQADQYLEKLLHVTPPKVSSDQEREWFTQLIGTYTLSVTGLNAYLRSPEQFIEEQLLRVPRAKQEYQAFGTAVHITLETMFAELIKTGELPKLKSVLSHFDEAIAREVVLPEHLALRKEFGERILAQYYHDVEQRQQHPIATEKFFGYGRAIRLDDIPLNGRIDRIDVLDQKTKTVSVIDYKTGRARTVGEIEGTAGTEEFSERELALPANIRGPYKRQLLFYKLLAELDPTFPYSVKEGVFDFVEPTDSGKFVTRRFELLDEDVNMLKDLIREVMKELRELQFLR